MARIEFFRNPLLARFLSWTGAFPVDRKAVPVGAMRHALRLLAEKKFVGIFPEGEILPAEASVLAGGPLKRGVCMLARRSGCPIVPCVIRGSAKLASIRPWLPIRRGWIEIAFGPPMFAPVEGSRRTRDMHLASRLGQRLRDLDALLPQELRRG